MANFEKIQELITYLKTIEPDKFNMKYYVQRENNECYTSACIAGHVCLINIDDNNNLDFYTEASKVLSLSKKEEFCMFLGGWFKAGIYVENYLQSQEIVLSDDNISIMISIIQLEIPKLQDAIEYLEKVVKEKDVFQNIEVRKELYLEINKVIENYIIYEKVKGKGKENVGSKL